MCLYFQITQIADYGWSSVNTYWVGLSQLQGGSDFRWSDGSSFDYYDWNPGEPNNAYGDESCVELYHFNGIMPITFTYGNVKIWFGFAIRHSRLSVKIFLSNDVYITFFYRKVE